MGRYAGARDTGSTTGVATMILALLSAGTVASITLVGVHQLAPAISQRFNASGPSSVRTPAGVVVTPRAPAAPHGTPQGHPSKPRRPAPSEVAVAPARGTSATTHRSVTQAVAAVVKVPLPAVAVPAVVPAPPVLTPPVPSTRPVTLSHRHGNASRRAPESRRGDVYPAQRNTSGAYGGRTARAHRGSGGCGEHGGRNHRAYSHNGYGGDRRRGAHGHDGNGGNGGRGAHGHDGYGGRGAHGNGDNGGRGAHGHDGYGGSQHDRHGH
jgi:hypothetical protein